MGSGDVAPPFLTSSLDESEWSASCPWGNIPWYPFYRRVGGPQSWSEHYGEEKSFLLLPGIESQLFSHTTCSVLTVPIELCQLHFHTSLCH
jgi:hypothetical protein